MTRGDLEAISSASLVVSSNSLSWSWKTFSTKPSCWASAESNFLRRKFDSAEAQQLGFVEKVFQDHDKLLEETTKLAEEIASKSPLVTSVIKKQINYARDNSVDDALDYHAIWNSALISSSDMESAMKAYMEKVSGDFEDLQNHQRLFPYKLS